MRHWLQIIGLLVVIWAGTFGIALLVIEWRNSESGAPRVLVTPVAAALDDIENPTCQEMRHAQLRQLQTGGITELQVRALALLLEKNC